MKFTNIIKVSLAALLLAPVACTGDFEAKNTNPEEVTDDMLDMDNLRVGAAFSQLAQNVFPVAKQISG